MLAVLLAAEKALAQGTPAQRECLQNRGIPWKAEVMAEVLGGSNASAFLANLEARRLVCCLAKGSGRGRRVSHVKLSAQAVAEAEHWARYAQSPEQRRRWLAKLYPGDHEWHEMTGAEHAEIQAQREAADQARLTRYSIGNKYQEAALNAVLDGV